PGGIGAQFGGNAEFAQHGAGLVVASNDQRIFAKAGAHFADGRIHVAGFSAVAYRELVLRRGDTERADHHGGQRVGELALEHRALTGDHAVVKGDLARKKGGKDVGQVDLARTLEVSVGQLKILAHDAEFDIFRAQDVANLPQHFLDPSVRAHVAGAVVS